MNKFFVPMLVLLFSTPASAEVITLLSGKTVEGKIIEQTEEYVKVETEDGPIVINRRLIEGSKRPRVYLPGPDRDVEEKLRQARQKEKPAPVTVQEPAAPKEEKKKESKKYSGPPVEVYVHPRDPLSQMLEEFLQSRGIPYTRYDIEESFLNRKRFEKLGDQYPVVKIGEDVVEGLDTERILELLKK